MHISQKAKDVAQKCANAYSAKRYRSWPAVAQQILNLGYTEDQTQTIMESKLVRWIADGSKNTYGRVSSRDVATELKSMSRETVIQEWC